MKTAVELKKKDYTIQVNYSPKAIKQKLMRFISKSGDKFEISAEEMASILVGQVNSEVLAASFVESDRVNVVEVERQIAAKADRDIKQGEEIRITYTHPYPVEFAIIEEAMKIARIKKDVKVFELTADYINSVKGKTTPEQVKFINRFYEFFKGLLKKKK